MAKKKSPREFVDYIPETDLPAFRRGQWFETAKITIQIFLMWIFAIGLFTFLLLVILAGVTVNILPNTDGERSLSLLFQEIASNAKAVALFALGFFFREYLNAKLVNGK